MKQVVLRIEDSAFERFMGIVSLCPQVEVASLDGIPDYGLDELTKRVALAIKNLQRNKVIRHLYDYTWIMVGIGDGVVEGMGPFGSPQKFMDYLKTIGVERVPSRTTLSTWYGRVIGKYPDWEFIDTQDPQEIQRRKNVFRQFISALNKAGI